MRILGNKIINRTENWKTARVFCDLSGVQIVRLVEKLGGEQGLTRDQVQFELFWKGMRDYFSGFYEEAKESCREAFAEHYISHFFGPLKKLHNNYRISTGDIKQTNTLFSNLFHTEIDIILETPTNLFIGEAKHQSSFRGNGDRVLVHQLIREYVMARILANHLRSAKKIVPFVVWGRSKTQRKPKEVEFMIQQGWMRKENVLTWEEIG